MYKDISHTADLAYEIIFQNGKELLRDVISIIASHTEVLEGQRLKVRVKKLQKPQRKCYNSLRNVDNVNEDFIFDMVNEIITIIDMGYFPTKVEEFCVELEPRNIVCKIKALTYHMLRITKEGNHFRLRMVFDV
uniref:Archease domain-containing protein n=1 Tax=Fervidobacterium thailandense TaxID=1008305 RepID=A0A7C5VL87_9BACT